MNVKLSPWVTAAIVAVLVLVIYAVYTTVDSPTRREAEVEKYIAASASVGAPPKSTKSSAPAAGAPKAPAATGASTSK